MADKIRAALQAFGDFWHPRMKTGAPKNEFIAQLEKMLKVIEEVSPTVRLVEGTAAFKLYDTYGFPLDLTELMARERGLTVDVAGFNKLMEEQKARARAAQKKQVIELSQVETTTPTQFVGYDKLESPAKVLEVVGVKDKTAVILDTSPLYAEMGGQVGDTGELEHGSQLWRITDTQKAGDASLHFIEEGGAHAPSRVADRALAVGPSAVGPSAGAPTGAGEAPALPVAGSTVLLSVDRARREAIQRHHTVTHLLALGVARGRQPGRHTERLLCRPGEAYV